VGDPLEAQAVEAAFFPPGRDYADDEVLYIGSIKSIIGHTEGTAGLAGLLRAALAVRHGKSDPNGCAIRTNYSRYHTAQSAVFAYKPKSTAIQQPRTLSHSTKSMAYSSCRMPTTCIRE
jgi:hypothetical protein